MTPGAGYPGIMINDGLDDLELDDDDDDDDIQPDIFINDVRFDEESLQHVQQLENV